MKKKMESYEHSLSCDFDGKTVADIKKMLDEYPDHARAEIRSEPIYRFGGWTDEEREFIVFTWEEDQCND